MPLPITIVNVVGARPNFMKIAPIMAAYAERGQRFRPILVHTGQHYDERMSDLFFRQLGIPQPDLNLGIGGGSHAVQTAEIMKAFEPVMQQYRPDAILVVGDVTSTIACSMVAAKLGIKVAHVEAGLRSFDRGMPEEINRVLTDAITDFYFCTEQSGLDNLAREGVDPAKVHMVGNVMIDTLLRHRASAEESEILQTLGLVAGRYAVLTLHRPSNVDDPDVFRRILDALEEVQGDWPVIFPIHPRTRKNMESGSLAPQVSAMKNLRIVEPLGYLDFMKLTAHARLVLTDSGGIQEETTILGVPCLTLRENTERPITLTMGTNSLVGTSTEGILQGYRQVMASPLRPEEQRVPPMWDGSAARRIVEILERELADA